PLDLNSFPTRRSSDLRPGVDFSQVHFQRVRGETRRTRIPEGSRRGPRGSRGVSRRHHLLGAEGGALAVIAALRPAWHHADDQGRSEEHTSELQSPYDL